MTTTSWADTPHTGTLLRPWHTKIRAFLNQPLYFCRKMRYQGIRCVNSLPASKKRRQEIVKAAFFILGKNLSKEKTSPYDKKLNILALLNHKWVNRAHCNAGTHFFDSRCQWHSWSANGYPYN
jgi:hypothetical protein